MGFDDDVCDRFKFESKWMYTRKSRGHNILSPWQVLMIGLELVHDVYRSEGNFKFVQCIELRPP